MKWSLNNNYKFRVVEDTTKKLSIYTGRVIYIDEEYLQIIDKNNKEVTIKQNEITRSVKL